MTYQPLLPAGKPIFTHAQRDDMITILEGMDDWISAGEIAVHICADGKENSKRIVRAIAESVGGSIISGQKGYRLTQSADAADVRHFCHAQLSQAAKMTDRAKDAARCKGIRI